MMSCSLSIAFVEMMPLGATGKLAKLQMRQLPKGYTWPEAAATPAR
ncbi:MAG: hypothetical protein ABL956_09990 [Hyphomonadaceae bacterium]